MKPTTTVNGRFPKDEPQITMSVNSEVRRAYADCFPKSNFEEASKIRNLSFRASLPVTVEEAIKIFKGIDPKFSYNEFTPDVLKHLGLDTQVTIAREYSVCIYVHTELLLSEVTINSLRKKMKADEGSEDELKDGFNTYRFWWD